MKEDHYIFTACKEGRFYVVQYLLNQGFDITKCDKDNNSLLDLALNNGWVDIANLLTEKLSNIHYTSDLDTTLHQTVKSEKKRLTQRSLEFSKPKNNEDIIASEHLSNTGNIKENNISCYNEDFSNKSSDDDLPLINFNVGETTYINDLFQNSDNFQ